MALIGGLASFPIGLGAGAGYGLGIRLGFEKLYPLVTGGQFDLFKELDQKTEIRTGMNLGSGALRGSGATRQQVPTQIVDSSPTVDIQSQKVERVKAQFGNLVRRQRQTYEKYQRAVTAHARNRNAGRDRHALKNELIDLSRRIQQLIEDNRSILQGVKAVDYF